MNAGKAFRNVRAVHVNNQGTGDVVLENSRAVLKEKNLLPGVYALPSPSVKSTSGSTFIFRTQQQTTATSNTFTVSAVTGVFS